MQSTRLKTTSSDSFPTNIHHQSSGVQAKKLRTIPKSARAKENSTTTKLRPKKDTSEGKTRDRGTLFEFFDSEINKEIYHPAPKVQVEPFRVPEKSKKIVAKVNHGHLQVDERLLKQECNRIFSERWYYHNTNSVIPEKVSRTVALFDKGDYSMDQFPRPKPSILDRIKCYDISHDPKPVNERIPRPWSAPAHILETRPKTPRTPQWRPEAHIDLTKQTEDFSHTDFEVV